MSKSPDDNIYMRKEYEKYKRLMLKTNALHRDNPKSTYPKSSKSEKWVILLSPMWYNRNKRAKMALDRSPDFLRLL